MLKSNPSITAPVKLKHDGYFMMRRPLKSLDALNKLFEKYRHVDRYNAYAITQELLKDEEISSSIRLASPGLYERLQKKSTTDKTLLQMMTLMRYVVRMSTRSTPFGAFASVSAGEFGGAEQFSLDEKVECRLEIDRSVLLLIDEKLRKKFAVSTDMRVRQTPVLYAMNGYVRFIERKFKGRQYNFELARIPENEYLNEVLRLTSNSTTIGILVSHLVGFDQEISREIALKYIAELVENGVLELDFGVRMIGKFPLETYLDDIKKAIPRPNEDPDISMLRKLSSMIQSDVPCTSDIAASRVDEVEKFLAEHRIEFSRGKSVHVDAFAKDKITIIPDALVGELEKTLLKLRQIFPHVVPKQITEFISAFERRFGDTFVPLMSALDPETGISFGYSTASVPWVKDMGLISRKHKIAHPTESSISDALLENISIGKKILDLDDIKAGINPSLSGFPKNFSVNITMFDTVNQFASNIAYEPALMLNGISAPGSTNLLTRFAARHDGLMHLIKKSIDYEAEQEHEAAIFAEIVHIPAPRAANVLPRPALFEYEIVLSGTGSVDEEHQIRIDDLLIGVVNNEIFLWSKRLNKRVVPTMSSAHNFYALGNLSIYQFLCLLPLQNQSSPSFKWPQSLQKLPFLPRVKCGAILVSRARWNIDQRKITEICNVIGLENWNAAREIFRHLGVDRWFAIEDGDNLLEVDIQSELSLLMLSDELAGKSSIVLTESPPRIGKTKFRTSHQSWHSEIVIPFHSVLDKNRLYESQFRKENFLNCKSVDFKKEDLELQPCFYMKVYGGEDYLEDFLLQTLAPLVQEATEKNILSKWFFVRYRDPDYHLRIRLFGNQPMLSKFSCEIIEKDIQPRIFSHEIANVVTEIYKPEYARYGGQSIMRSVEKLFFYDSEYYVNVRGSCINDSSDDMNWKAALSGTVQYMSDFSFSQQDIMMIVESQRNGFLSEFELNKNQYLQLGNLYKKNKNEIEKIASILIGGLPQLSTSLEKRSSSIKKLINEEGFTIPENLKIDILASVIHMQCNRLFTGMSRSQEFIMWDFILRALRSIKARENSKKSG